MSYKGKFSLGLLLALFIIALIWFKYPFCKKLSCINIDIDGFKESLVYENSPSIYRALYENELGDMVRVEKKRVNVENAESVINSETQTINAYFENAISPYPGQISDEIECSKDFVPELKTENISGVEVDYFEVYLTERLTIGACSNDQAKHKEIIVWYYCENQENMYQFEIISEKENFSQNRDYFYGILNSLSCK